MNNNYKRLVILDAICTVIWLGLTMLDIYEGQDTSFMLLHAACACCFGIAGVLNYKKYKNNK